MTRHIAKKYRIGFAQQNSDGSPASTASVQLIHAEAFAAVERNNASSTDTASFLPARGYVQGRRGTVEINTPIYRAPSRVGTIPGPTTLEPLLRSCGFVRYTSGTALDGSGSITGTSASPGMPANRDLAFYRLQEPAPNHQPVTLFCTNVEDRLIISDARGSAKLMLNTGDSAQIARATFGMMGNLADDGYQIDPANSTPSVTTGDFYPATNITATINSSPTSSSRSAITNITSIELDTGAAVAHPQTISGSGYAFTVITGYTPVLTMSYLIGPGVPIGEQWAQYDSPAQIRISAGGFRITATGAICKSSTRANTDGLVSETSTWSLEGNGSFQALEISL